MTTTNNEIGERVAKIEERVSNMNDRLDKMDTKIDQILDKLDDSDKRYVTRAELKFTQFLLGIVASAVGLFFLLKDHIR